MNRKHFSLFIGLIALLPFANLHAQCVNDTNNIHTFYHNNEKYELVKENLTWVEAAACAVERGGQLAEITGANQQNAIFGEVPVAGIDPANTIAPDGGGASYFWLGGNDISIEGDWVWDGTNSGNGSLFWQGVFGNGNPVGGAYNNWGNEPDNYNNQDALGLAITNWPLGVAGEWNDVDKSNSLYFLIQHPTNNIQQNEKQNTFSFYPNPASQQITIEIDDLRSVNCILKFRNILGETVMEISLPESPYTINTSELPKGLYLLHLTRDNKALPVRKLIIR